MALTARDKLALKVTLITRIVDLCRRRTPATCGVLVVALAIATTLIPVACKAQASLPGTSEPTPLDFLPALAGDYFRLVSASVGRPFHVFVRLPESYDADASIEYPTVYVLDGDSLFPIIAPTHLLLTVDYDAPEAIVVGIAYGSFDPSINKRGYDFTVPTQDADETRGGAPAFHAFLEDELVPLIERRFRADAARRILLGQSRGGGMVLYSAFTEPDFFWGRIASNPTFDPGRDLLFSRPADATRDDLRLVVTSAENDIPELREAALEWFAVWVNADDLPWELDAVNLDGARHASHVARSYRTAILSLFDLEY